jgi:hypothetical protein
MTTRQTVSTARPFGLSVRASVIVRRFRAIALALAVLLIGACSLPRVLADTGSTFYVQGHDYVAYDANHVPCSQGTIEDVTGEIYFQNDHDYDLYGNVLVFNSDGSIADSSGRSVGFVYQSAPPQPVQSLE